MLKTIIPVMIIKNEEIIAIDASIELLYALFL